MFPYGYDMTGWGYACTGFATVVVLALLAAAAVAVISVAVWNQQHRHTGSPAATAQHDEGRHGI